jgi:putative two-component system response regulator
MNDSSQTGSMRVVVLDDNHANLSFAEQMFRGAGYTNVFATDDPVGVIDSIERDCPDLLVLDLHMPQLDGFEVLARLQPVIAEPEALPVLVATADTTRETRERALALGARDFVTKPLETTEVLLRARNLLQMRKLQLALRRHNADLAKRVRERTAELERSRLETLQRLALVAEFRDSGTWEHANRIGQTAQLLAEAIGLPVEESHLIGQAAPLHDLGKIAVPDRILLKPGSLTDAEWKTMRSHTTIGAKMLSGGSCPVLRAAEQIALSHHERFDGRGYPNGRAGEDIPIAARIVAVVDVFDALTHERPYKPACSVEEALETIAKEVGHFDPRVVDALLALDPEHLMTAGSRTRSQTLVAA